MARMSEGNRLYLYKLLKEELGIGRQSSVSQFEDVLSADDIAPQDLECESTLELLESLDDIVKLTVFKKGRVFVTLLSHERYDAILERLEKPAEKDASDKSTKAKQKPWKRKKSAKDPTPAKPRKKKTPVVEPVAEDFVVEEPVVETAEPEPVETTEAERTEKTEVGHIEKTELNQTTEAEQVELPEPEQVVGAELVKEADAQQTEAVNINQTEKELTAETSDTEVSVIAPEVSSADEKRPSITLTIVHDPDDEVALDAAASQAAPNPELARPPAPPSLTRQEHTSAHDLPQSIAQDVFCGTPQLRILHQL
ncbi:MAG: hypothetical protein IJ125_06985 [Atopobiaceae bacterium]|nr:hypothetical protein [Atopobiaceae bacterium]